MVFDCMDSRSLPSSLPLYVQPSTDDHNDQLLLLHKESSAGSLDPYHAEYFHVLVSLLNLYPINLRRIHGISMDRS